MGMTHMLGGGSPRLARLGARYPLLDPRQVVLFGFDIVTAQARDFLDALARQGCDVLEAAAAPLLDAQSSNSAGADSNAAAERDSNKSVPLFAGVPAGGTVRPKGV